jgi:hypothetical protein
MRQYLMKLIILHLYKSVHQSVTAIKFSGLHGMIIKFVVLRVVISCVVL